MTFPQFGTFPPSRRGAEISTTQPERFSRERTQRTPCPAAPVPPEARRVLVHRIDGRPGTLRPPDRGERTRQTGGYGVLVRTRVSRQKDRERQTLQPERPYRRPSEFAPRDPSESHQSHEWQGGPGDDQRPGTLLWRPGHRSLPRRRAPAGDGRHRPRQRCGDAVVLQRRRRASGSSAVKEALRAALVMVS